MMQSGVISGTIPWHMMQTLICFLLGDDLVVMLSRTESTGCKVGAQARLTVAI